jgi:uncharacterized protein (TIRG00374 family)
LQPLPDIVVTESRASAPEQRGLSVQLDGMFGKALFLIPLGIIGNLLLSLVFANPAMLGSLAIVKPGYLFLAMLLAITPWFTGSFRLLLWSRLLGKKLRYQDVLKIAVAAELGAAVSPPMIGGSAVKTAMLMHKGFSGGSALSLTILENLEDAVFFIIMVPIALTLSSAWALPTVKAGISGMERLSGWVVPTAAGTMFLAGFLVFRLHPHIGARFPFLRKIEHRIVSLFAQVIETYRTIISRGKAVVALTMTLTVVQWVCRYSIISVLLLGFGIQPRPILYMALQVIVFAVAAFIPTPGGTGGAEGVFFMIYRSFLPHHLIGVVTALWRFFTFYVLLILAAVLFLLFRIRTPVKRSASQDNVLA